MAAAGLAAELSAPEVEEAAETGRRAAAALLRGQRDVFERALAADPIAASLLGDDVWRDLSERQREQIRSVVRSRFAEALEPPRAAPGDVGWSFARAEEDGVSLFLGLRYPAGIVKTRWWLVPSPRGWSVRDVVLSEPGLSLAREAGRSLPRDAVRRRDWGRAARAAALPRVVGLAAIAAVVLFVGRRLGASARRLLIVTAAAPAILFLVDGSLAVKRALSETYTVAEVLPPPPWRAAERDALAAQREGRLEDARRAWGKAVAAGAPAAPADYQLGVALKAAGRTDEAKAAFHRALAHSPAAPGAGKELGIAALAEGNAAEARERLERYVADAGPDPDALSALAVAQSNLGESARAVESVEQARALLLDRWQGLRLEAQVYAQAGNAGRTIETLRALEADGRVDRESLRSDPAYLPIAADPEWVAFLAETPTPARTPAE